MKLCHGLVCAVAAFGLSSGVFASTASTHAVTSPALVTAASSVDGMTLDQLKAENLRLHVKILNQSQRLFDCGDDGDFPTTCPDGDYYVGDGQCCPKGDVYNGNGTCG